MPHSYTTAMLLSCMINLVLPTALFADDDTRAVVHDERGNVVRGIEFGNCVRTKWQTSADECGVKVVQQKTIHREITTEDRTIYFGFNQARILDSEKLKLDSLAEVLKVEKSLRGVHIVGYADRIGTTGYNIQLSRARALAVEQYLRAHGYLNTTMAKMRWLGKSDPITHCPDNMAHSDLINCLQRDRRVEIELDYIKEDKSE